MTRYLYNPPAIIKKIFNEFYWQSTNNKILLTFDDGPNPGITEKILEQLSSLNIKALHFCVGNNIKNPISNVLILSTSFLKPNIMKRNFVNYFKCETIAPNG